METKSKIILIGLFLLMLISVSADKLDELEDCLLVKDETFCFGIYELVEGGVLNTTSHNITYQRPQEIINSNTAPSYVQTYDEYEDNPMNIINTSNITITEKMEVIEQNQIIDNDEPGEESVINVSDDINITLNKTVVVMPEYLVLNGSYIVNINGTNVTMNESEFNNTYLNSEVNKTTEQTEQEKKNNNLIIVFIVIVILFILFIVFLLWVLK